MDEEGGYSKNDSGISPKSKKVYSDIQNIVALSLKQFTEITQGSDDSFRLYNQEIAMATIVARIVDVQAQQTNTTLHLDDGTGFLEIKLWKLTLSDDITPGSYIRIFGNLRQWEGKTSMVSSNLRKVTDFNEVIFHNLEVIQSCYYLTKKSLKGNSTKKLDFGDDIGDDLAGLNEGNLTSLQQAVLELLKKSKSAVGVPLNDINSSLGDRYGFDEIQNAVISLFEEGLVFSVKENHFKVTSEKK